MKQSNNILKKYHVYLRYLANRLELRDWSITPARRPTKRKFCDAYCETTYGRKRIVIWVAKDFESFSPERKRHALVHELIHCHLSLIQHTISSHQGADARKSVAFLDVHVHTGIEYAIDALADTIDHHLWTYEEWERRFKKHELKEKRRKKALKAGKRALAA